MDRQINPWTSDPQTEKLVRMDQVIRDNGGPWIPVLELVSPFLTLSLPSGSSSEMGTIWFSSCAIVIVSAFLSLDFFLFDFDRLKSRASRIDSFDCFKSLDSDFCMFSGNDPLRLISGRLVMSIVLAR